MIGLGEVAQSIHLPVLRDQRDRWTIAGVFDLSRKLMDLCLSQNPGAVGFASAEALIASRDIDVVFVLSSDETHASSRQRRDRGAASTSCWKSPPA